MSPCARKRLEHTRRELLALEAACASTPESSSARRRYQMRLGQVQAGWRQDMKDRAKRMLDPGVPRVWGMVDNIRQVLGDRYGDMAAEIAVSVLAPLMRQKKPLAACR